LGAMKNFFSSFFATLLALLVFLGGACLLGFVLLAAIAASGNKPVTVEKGSYLVLNMSVNLQDTPEQNEDLVEFMEALGDGSGPRPLQLRAAVRAIEAAANDDAIAGLFLTGNFRSMNYGSGYAALRELRGAIENFKKSGKPVKAYLGIATARNYYVASVADELILDRYGAVMMPGLATQPLFLAGAFEKFGIGVQVTRVGKYKSAVEPYVRKDMSPENRAQTQKLLDDVWTELVAGIEQSRKLEPGALQKIIDEHGLLRNEKALENKLVDRLAYQDEVLDELKEKTGRKGSKSSFKQIAIADYARLVSRDGATPRRGTGVASVGGKEKIGIIYAEGDIVDGDGKEEGLVYGAKFAREIRKMRQDDNVKAIVLRVNSPGGSATASEQIQRELRLAMKDKPVVVSMGTVAASGGYWIATYSDRIFAENATITGSIGVFGTFFNVEKLAGDKLGLSVDTVKTGKFADAGTIMRPKTDAELAIFQGFVDFIYDEFTGKVADSRKLDLAAVKEIAQGRVWSGAEAKKLGLVDEIGNLDDAVRFAAKKAGLGDNYRVAEYPHKKLFSETLAEAFEPGRKEMASGGPMGELIRAANEELKTLLRFNDPQGIYARLPLNLHLN
jgi:protease-4